MVCSFLLVASQVGGSTMGWVSTSVLTASSRRRINVLKPRSFALPSPLPLLLGLLSKTLNKRLII